MTLKRGSTSDLIVPRETLDFTKQHKLDSAKILLVEDGPTNRKLIKLVLSKAGADVHCAENGRAGVDAANAQK